MSSSPVHPILIDTSGLIAAANTNLWPAVCDNLKLTTTNVCEHELARHVRDKNEYAPQDSREYQLHHGSQKTLDVMDEGDVPITTVNCVPRPHGSDAGEESLRRQLSQDPDPYDSYPHGRRRSSVNSTDAPKPKRVDTCSRTTVPLLPTQGQGRDQSTRVL